MDYSEDTVPKLVGLVYDAALDEQKWLPFLEAFAQAVDGCCSMLRSFEQQNGAASFVAGAGYDYTWQSACCEHPVRTDCLTNPLQQFKTGDIARAGEQVICMPEQHKTGLHNDCTVQQDKAHELSSLIFKDGSHTLLFAAQRGKYAGAFGEKEKQLMSTLAPHIVRAVHVHRKLNSISLEKEWALCTLDQLRMGVFLTNSLGVPLFVNRAAEQMMAEDKEVCLCQGRLALPNQTETALLHKLIAGAAHGGAGGDMRISMRNRIAFLHCLVVPVSPDFSARLNVPHGSGCVALFFSRPGSLKLPPKRLARLYGLSPAESRLVAKLAEFNSLEQTANDLGIAMGTARAQLATVFTKTGVKGQAELLMLLATGTLAHCRNA